MKKFIKSVLKEIKGKVDYGDVRMVNTEYESIAVKNGVVEAVRHSRSQGFGVRVLIGNGWGFSSSSKITKEEVSKVVKDAMGIAWASQLEGYSVQLSPVEPIKGSYKTNYKIDPFKIKLDDKINLLIKVFDQIKKEKKIIIVVSNLVFVKEDKYFGSTEGCFVKQQILHSGGGLRAMAPADGELQIRSYGNHGQAGYEFIKALRLVKNAKRVRDELKTLLSAPPCPAGNRILVLDQHQMALQIHESIGHATELDRVLGTEASYAGTSFLKTSDLGKLKYGAKIVNVVADAKVKGGLGTFGFDDEGVAAKKEKLIEDGVLVGFQSSRETAPVVGKQSSGGMRADGWNRIPLIRMTNINLLPGNETFEQLVGKVKDGIYMSTNRSWSIDDRRLNFQFGCEIAYHIKKGKLIDVYKNPVYTGITPIFWGNCTGIANRKNWLVMGVANCGKGEPGQTMRVGHGTAPARFADVEIGAS